MMTRRKIIIISIILLVLLGLYKLSRIFAPGSYPFAETYQLNYLESEVKVAIEKFKLDNPEFIVPKVTIEKNGSWDLDDHQTENPGYWYVVYFYIKEENKILMTWTRPSNKGGTTFAFVSINEGLDIGHWKDINDDFGFMDNRKLKKQFEEKILAQIKLNLPTAR